MKTTQIVPGCIHLETEATGVLFGSPPEILKFLSLKGFSIPEAIVLPDGAHVHGVSQMALEFPAYYHLFFKKDRSARRPVRVIGTAQMCARARDILQITLIGPSRAMMKSWNISKTRSAMLCDMMDYLAIKIDGTPVTVDDVFTFILLPVGDAADVALDPECALRLVHTGFNRFAVIRGG